MNCVVLAAGYATRLYPLTEHFPKPLLKVGKKTIIDWLVDDVDRFGKIERFTVVSNARYADNFRQWRDDLNGALFIFEKDKDGNDIYVCGHEDCR